MAKQVTEEQKSIVQGALGALAPSSGDIETRPAYGGGNPDVVLSFKTADEAKAVAQSMFKDMGITNATGQQKRVALRADGKWEVLVSDAQMKSMQSFAANRDVGLAAAGGPPGGPPVSPPPSPKAAAVAASPKENTCSVLASKVPVPSLTFTFNGPQELEAFTKSFPKTVPNYEVKGNALIIKQSDEPGSIPVNVSESGSVSMSFSGKGDSEDIMLAHLQKLLPKTHSQFSSLYFTPGEQHGVPYKLASEAETTTFKRSLALARLENIALAERDIIRSKRGIYTDEMLKQDNLDSHNDRLNNKKAEILKVAETLKPDQKKAVKEYIEDAG